MAVRLPFDMGAQWEEPALPSATCPGGHAPLAWMVVRERKYWYCEAEKCQGCFKGTKPECPNLGCDKLMSLTYGTNGRWKDQWFWSCPLDACSVMTDKSGFDYYGTEDPVDKRTRWD